MASNAVAQFKNQVRSGPVYFDLNQVGDINLDLVKKRYGQVLFVFEQVKEKFSAMQKYVNEHMLGSDSVWSLDVVPDNVKYREFQQLVYKFITTGPAYYQFRKVEVDDMPKLLDLYHERVIVPYFKVFKDAYEHQYIVGCVPMSQLYSKYHDLYKETYARNMPVFRSPLNFVEVLDNMRVLEHKRSQLKPKFLRERNQKGFVIEVDSDDEESIDTLHSSGTSSVVSDVANVVMVGAYTGRYVYEKLKYTQYVKNLITTDVIGMNDLKYGYGYLYLYERAYWGEIMVAIDGMPLFTSGVRKLLADYRKNTVERVAVKHNGNYVCVADHRYFSVSGGYKVVSVDEVFAMFN